MNDGEKQFLITLIEKYGAPAVVREIKARLAAMVDLDWNFDRLRWVRQLDSLNREQKLQHNLSQVAKRLAFANKRIELMRRSIEGHARAYENDVRIKFHKNARKRSKEQTAQSALSQAERLARKQEEAAKREAARKQREERERESHNALLRAHKKYLEERQSANAKQLEEIDRQLGEEP